MDLCMIFAKSFTLKRLFIKALLISSLLGGSLPLQAGNGGNELRSYYFDFLMLSLFAGSAPVQNAIQSIRELYNLGFENAEREEGESILESLSLDELEELTFQVLLLPPNVGSRAPQQSVPNNSPSQNSNIIETYDEDITLSVSNLADLALHFTQGRIVLMTQNGPRSLSVSEFIRMLLVLSRYNYLPFDDGVLHSTNAVARLQMILNHMTVSSQTISFHSFFDACREVYFRLAMISRFSILTSLSSFNSFNDHSFALGPQWVSTPAYFKNGKKWQAHNNIAFKVKNSKNAYQSIQQCYIQQNHKQIMDCSGTVITHMYGSLALTLGENTFNQMVQNNPNFLIISTMNAKFKFPKKTGKGLDERVQHPILQFQIIEEVEIDSLEELIPGDVVYFVNHPWYEVYFQEGYYAGEYCVYLGVNENGERIFSGLGLGSTPHTFESVVNILKDAYENDTGETFPEPNDFQEIEEVGILGNTFPSLDSAIFSMRSFRSGEALSSSKNNKGSKKTNTNS